MTIFIDISELYQVNYVTGIQRVVTQVTTRWIQSGYEIKLGVFQPKERTFVLANNQHFSDYYLKRNKKKDYLSDREIRIEDLDSSYVFFDFDSVWMNPNKRSWLLPLLKRQGVYIAVHIYDIIPVTEPQYCHELTVLHFLDYLGAHMENAELIIANAQATIDAVNRAAEGMKHHYDSAVVSLGSDIARKTASGMISVQVERIIADQPYILMVGTLEPRKNHDFVLNAFEQGLFEKGLNLVFAGRRGWNIDRFMDRMEHHSEFNKRLFFAEGLSDIEIASLYEHAFAVAFASYNEGFGLPIIEAFDRGVPVFASDIPVLRETGGEFAEYFSLENPNSLVDLVRHYLEDPEAYQRRKDSLAGYHRVTWDECAMRMYEAIAEHFRSGAPS